MYKNIPHRCNAPTTEFVQRIRVNVCNLLCSVPKRVVKLNTALTSSVGAIARQIVQGSLAPASQQVVSAILIYARLAALVQTRQGVITLNRSAATTILA